MQRYSRRFLAAFLVAAAGMSSVAVSFTGSGGGERALAPAPANVQTLDAAAFKAHNQTLADPSFEGRAPGSKGIELAATYVETNFRNAGLRPAFPTGEGADAKPFTNYRQSFQLGSSTTVTTQDVSWLPGGQAAGVAPNTLAAGTDFNVLAFSGNAEATGTLAFAGYAINEGTDGYSSFPEGTDLTGKIAIVLRFEPMDEAGKSKWAKNTKWSFNAGLEPKIGQLAKRNAAAIILVNPPGADDERATKLETIDSVQSRTGQQKIPVIMMSVEKADALVKAADPQGRSLLDLRKVVDEQGQVIDLPNATVTLKTETKRDPIMTANIGGVLEGRGALKDDYIVIGAHYDHVGFGRFGSRDPNGNGKLHPGADDNASGTSGLLVVADKLAKAYADTPADVPMRSILFMAFSGEESGLNGSRHYTKNMIVPKEKHTIMFNMDMIGRLREGKLEASGIGTGEGLEEWIKPYFDSSGLTIASKPGGSGPSDHASFFAAGIPVIFYFTGLHEQYHMPTDTSDLILADGAAQVIDLCSRIALDTAKRSDGFAYMADPRRKDEAAKPTDPNAPAPTTQGAVSGSKVRFGITPGDYNDEQPGVLIGDVAKGWSAEKAGLKSGDRMIKWNGKDIPSVEGWMPLLGECKAGDKVQVTIVRDGKEQVIEVELMARDNTQK